MPGRIWYAVALLLFVATAAIAGVLVYTRLSGLARELPQIIVPGEADLTFDRPGTYTIYLERQSVVNGRIFSTSEAIGDLQVRVTAPAGASLELESPGVSSNYSIGGRSGVAVLTCTISQPGRYHLAAGYPDGRSEPQGVLAIGLGVPGKIVSTILMALAIGFAGFVVALAIAAVTFWRRRKFARRVVPAPAPDPARP